MSRHHGLALALLAVVGTSGCQWAPSRRAVAAAEPGLDPPARTGAAADGAPERAVTFVDRHPLFGKPREYYENSGSNKVVKTAAAAVVGVPVGIFGELKQIVVGAPSDARNRPRPVPYPPE